MYYEEKIINGVLCWRGGPEDEFQPYTLEELSRRYVSLENRTRQAIREAFAKLRSEGLVD